MTFVDEGGKHVHVIRNEGAVEARTITVQLLPAGATRRIDAPGNPACTFLGMVAAAWRMGADGTILRSAPEARGCVVHDADAFETGELRGVDPFERLNRPSRQNQSAGGARKRLWSVLRSAAAARCCRAWRRGRREAPAPALA